MVSAPFVIRFESVNSIAPEAAAPDGSESLWVIVRLVKAMTHLQVDLRCDA
jgi:hypothetical protein